MSYRCVQRNFAFTKYNVGLIKQLSLKLSIRSLSTSLSEPELQQFPEDVKPFYEIPGPRSIPWFGTLFSYGLGIYSFEKLYESGMKKYLKYGNIVREEIFPGQNTVWIFNPEDIKQLILYETTSFPTRNSHLAIKKFRESRPLVYSSGGLLSMDGEEWWKLRQEFQKGFSDPAAVRTYLPATDGIISDFVNRQLLFPCDEDFVFVLLRLSLQLSCLVAFDAQLDSFSPQELQLNSRSSQLIESVIVANYAGYVIDNVGFQNRQWKRFNDASLILESVAVEFVKKKAKALKNSSPLNEYKDYVPSLLELYLTSSSVNNKGVVGMVVDLLLAGIESMAYTASFALYHLSRNHRVQDILRMEAKGLLQSPDQAITPDILSSARYAKAVLKEVFRMNPISVGVKRCLTEDIVLSGYHIPKGTNIVTQNQVICRLDKYFANPNVFLPERWIKGSPVFEKSNPYLVLPFGHGGHTCLGRHLAEQQLISLLLRIVWNHKIQWKSDKPLGCKAMPFNKPDRYVDLSFTRL